MEGSLLEKCVGKLTHGSGRNYHHTKAKNCNGNQPKSGKKGGGHASRGGGTFVCDDCNKTFVHEQNLYMHKKISHDGCRYNCGYCSNKTFFKRESAKKHSKRSHTTTSGSPLPFQIDFVIIPGANGASSQQPLKSGSHSKAKGSSKKKQTTNKNQNQTATGSGSSAAAATSSTSYQNSSSSSSSSVPLQIQCEFCSERFSDQSSLATHKSNAHQWLRYRCGYCWLTCFDNEVAIKSHIEHYHRLPTGVIPPFNFHLVKINENGMVTNMNAFNQMGAVAVGGGGGPTVNNAPPQSYYGSPSTSAATAAASYFFPPPPTNERPLDVVVAAHQQQQHQHQQEMGMNLGLGGGGVNVNDQHSSSGGKNNHLCRICLQTFGSPSALSAHFKQEHDGKRSRCEKCGALFANKHNLMRNLN